MIRSAKSRRRAVFVAANLVVALLAALGFGWRNFWWYHALAAAIVAFFAAVVGTLLAVEWAEDRVRCWINRGDDE